MLANSAGAVGGAYPKYPDPHHAGAIIQRCVCRTPRCFRLLRLERKWKGSYICLAKMVPSPRDLTYSKCPKISEAKFSKLLTYIDSIPIVHWWKKRGHQHVRHPQSFSGSTNWWRFMENDLCIYQPLHPLSRNDMKIQAAKAAAAVATQGLQWWVTWQNMAYGYMDSGSTNSEIWMISNIFNYSLLSFLGGWL